MIWAGGTLGSVLRKACGSNWPAGSRSSTQRSATVGAPGWYQRAVPVAASTWAVAPPYQGTVRGSHVVPGSSTRVANVGGRRHSRRGGPLLPGPGGGGGAYS